MSTISSVEIQAHGCDVMLALPGNGGVGNQVMVPDDDVLAWMDWLHTTFMITADENLDDFSKVMKMLKLDKSAQSPSQAYSVLANALAQGELEAWRLPLPNVPEAPAGADADGGSDSSRANSGASQAGAGSNGGAAQSKGASGDAPAPDAADAQTLGDPVAPASGEELLQLIDFEIQGPMPLALKRWYRSSLCERDSGLGYGWYCDLLRPLWQDDDHAYLLDHEGRQLRFPHLKPKEVGWQAATGHRLEHKADGRMVLTEPGGLVWVFLPHGRGQWRVDAIHNLQGHCWLFYYDNKGRLSAIDVAPERRLVLGWQDSHLASIGLKQGKKTLALAHYHYDDNANLSEARSQKLSEQYRYRGHLLSERRLASGYRFLLDWQGTGPGARCIRTRGEDGSDDYAFEYDTLNRQTRVTDAFGHQWLYRYDNAGRITARRGPDGGEHQWTYDTQGRLRRHRLPDGRAWRYDFDRRGLPVCDWQPDGRRHRRVFNGLGICIAETLPDGRFIERKVDGIGRLLSERRPDGSQWQYHYNDAGWLQQAQCDDGRVERYGLDAKGQPLAVEKNRHLRRFAYDDLGRPAGQLVHDLVTQYQYDGDKLVASHQFPENAPAQQQSWHFGYDSAGRLSRFENALGQVHRFEYDGRERPLRYIRPDGKTVHYSYDKARRLVDLVRPDGGRWQLGYDALGQVDRVAAPDGRDIRFRYDANGQIVHREQSGDWVQHLKRDAGGRVTRQNSQGKGRQPVAKQFRYDHLGRMVTAACEGRRLAWRYDSQGRMVRHDQDGHSVGFGYGHGNQLQRLSLPDGTQIAFAFEGERWCQVQVNGETVLTRSFDDSGREQNRQALNNQQSQVFDRHDRLVNRRWQGQQSHLRRYSWDAESRLEELEDSDTGETRFERDSVGQLISDGDIHFRYDEGGNRRSDQDQLGKDRLLRTESAWRRYDALGAEVELRGERDESRYFDAEGGLIAFNRGGLQLRYGYDALNRRAWRKGPDGTVNYLWQGDNLLGEQRNGRWQWFIRDPQTQEPLLTIHNGEVYFYELDWRKAPIRLWDSQGQCAWKAQSDAWGNYQCEGDIHQPLRLPGQFEDELTGLYFNRFRDYDPKTGRYLTPDPLGLKGGLNSYRYTRNPVDFVDILGLCDESPVMDALGEMKDGALEALAWVDDKTTIPPLAELQSEVQSKLDDMGADAVAEGQDWKIPLLGVTYAVVAAVAPTSALDLMPGGKAGKLGKLGKADRTLKDFKTPSYEEFEKQIGGVYSPLPNGVDSHWNDYARPVTKEQFIEHVENNNLSNAFNKPVEDIYNEVYLSEKNSRPEPSTYLNPDFAESHKSMFLPESARVDAKNSFEKYNKRNIDAGLPFGRPDGVFMSPGGLIDDLHATNDPKVMESTLGFDSGTFASQGGMVRTVVKDPESLNLRFATGRESGANPLWVPGGYTLNTKGGKGMPEMIMDPIPSPSNSDIVDIYQ
ncbi:RHS repeat-associated core domain-containing protein [Gallaecimonas pentaromativorans]|uniref:RHS repeat-associated protein n=1 Tax=Gallaecimonas pentaromativorans TaxID=584787 RepID=A0A3N1PV08_9GAMM|nr:RHS repeat-associated core domain-containing protein [Gallaecimonas pentaromativorans]ROQ30597.1 RHS repeat-associated protein [Gallaecimonas pentaromativorans]